MRRRMLAETALSGMTGAMLAAGVLVFPVATALVLPSAEAIAGGAGGVGLGGNGGAPGAGGSGGFIGGPGGSPE